METSYGGAMVLPSSYVVMDQDEMTYVEGGGTRTNYWWGISLTMSRNESIQLQYLLGQAILTGGAVATVTGGIGLILGVATGGIGAIISGSIMIGGAGAAYYYSLMKNSLSNHTTSKGVILNLSDVKIFWCNGR